MKITKQQLKQIIREELAEAESLDLSSLEPQVERIVQNIESEIARLPESAHSVVRQAVASRLSAEEVAERKLTDAEYKKKKEIAAAIKRDDPGKSDSERYAIATAAAKKSANKK